MIAIVTFIWTLIALVFALALTETMYHVRLTVFGSRNALLVPMVATAAIFAVWRWRRQRSKAAGTPAPSSRQHAETASGQPNAGPPTRFAPESNAGPPPRFAPQPIVAPQPCAAPRSEPLNAIVAASRQAVVFRQDFPPRHDGDATCFWGGTPVASRTFAWPRGEDAHGETPLHFVMQVDCAKVPANARLGALPDKGILYFFLDLQWAATGGFRVVYEEPPVLDRVRVAPPSDLGPVYGEHATWHFKWARSLDECPRLLPRWSFEPVAIEIPEHVADEGEEEEGDVSRFLWRGGTPVGDALRAAQGEEVASAPFSVKELANADRTLRRPFDGFPHDWRALGLCSGLLEAEAARHERHADGWMFKELSAEDRQSELQRIGREAKQWLEVAASRPPFAAVAREESDRFWSWFSGHSRVSLHVLPAALTESIEASLAESPEAASRIPPEVAARVHSRHALTVRTERGFHTNIPDRMLAPPVDIHGNHEDRVQTHLLLLEMSGNEGLGHHFGEGVYQFWITPQDLRDRRFDRVVLTTDAY